MILCCGEALIDMIPVKAENGGEAFAPLTGGAVFNTSIALGRLNVPTGLLSGVSTDLFGEQLQDDLEASNVSTKYLIRSDRPTTMAFVKLTDGHAEYTFYDENSAGSSFDASDLPKLSKDVTAVYCGGISLCAEPAADAYADLFVSAAENCVTMIDPNIRPSFIKNETLYRERLKKMFSVADIVKVSDEDLDWIVPTGGTIEERVRTLQGLGAKTVIVTRGVDGASAYLTELPVVEVTVPRVEVVDTVGAGDTFNAGFLAQLQTQGVLKKNSIGHLKQEEIFSALEYAAKVAAVTVSRAGANPPFLSEL